MRYIEGKVLYVDSEIMEIEKYGIVRFADAIEEAPIQKPDQAGRKVKVFLDGLGRILQIETDFSTVLPPVTPKPKKEERRLSLLSLACQILGSGNSKIDKTQLLLLVEELEKWLENA